MVHPLRVIICLSLLKTVLFANYVVNGNFSQPPLNGSFRFQTGIYNWTGTNYIFEGRFTIGYGQYMNLQQYTNNVGYIQQIVTLPSSGKYDLTFYWKCIDTPSKYNIFLILWNQVAIKTLLPSFTNNVLFENITLIGKRGSNILMFMQLPTFGSSSAYSGASGYFIDQVSIIQSFTVIVQPPPITHEGFLSDNQVTILAFFFSTPLSQTALFKSIFLLLDDLWLYNYNNQTYTGLISLVFWTATEIQNLKFDIIESFVNLSSIKNHFKTSDYKNFSITDFVEIEKASSIFLDSNFAFLIYSVPQNTLIVLILFVLFRLTRQHRMSRYLRKYFFFKTSLLQILIESNLAYFSFVCFNNLSQTFCFKWQDRAALIFTVIFLFGLLAFSFAYYFLMKIFLVKDSYHFIDGLYRCNASYEYLTLAHLLRNFLRGVISSVLHYNYGFQLLMLTVNQLTSMVLCLRYQLIFSIFHSSTIYCLSLMYRFLFILLNMALYTYWSIYTQTQDVKALILDLESVIVYLFIGQIILQTICKFLPISKGHGREVKQRVKIQKFEFNQIIKKKEKTMKMTKKNKIILMMDIKKNQKKCEMSNFKVDEHEKQMKMRANKKQETDSKKKKK